MARARSPSPCGAPDERAVSYTRWCEPAGYRPDGLSGCLCASLSRSGDCGGAPVHANPAEPQVAGAATSPSSVARSSSEIAPSLSQIPK